MAVIATAQVPNEGMGTGFVALCQCGSLLCGWRTTHVNFTWRCGAQWYKLMGYPVEECSAKAKVTSSQLSTYLWCSLIL